MALYHTCMWAGDGLGSDDFPDCGRSDDTCPDGLATVAQSHSGSGEVPCKTTAVSMAPEHPATISTRTYCCDNSDHNIKWSFCSIHGTDGNTAENPGYCPGDCPEGRYRVALDQHAPECSSGAASTCCVPTAQTLDTDLPESDLSKAEALDMFLLDTEGYCTEDLPSSTSRRRQVVEDTTHRELGVASLQEEVKNHQDPTHTHIERPLEERGIILEHPAVLREVEDLITDLLDDRASPNEVDAWNGAVRDDYPFLQTYALEPYMNEFPNRTSFAHYGDYLAYHGINYGGVRDIACGPNYFNAHIAYKRDEDAEKPLVCNCGDVNVCGADGTGCPSTDADEDDDDDDDDDDDRSELRIRDSVGSPHLNHLFKRAGGKKKPYTVKITFPDGTQISRVIESYPVSTDRTYAGETISHSPLTFTVSWTSRVA